MITLRQEGSTKTKYPGIYPTTRGWKPWQPLLVEARS